MSKQCQQPQAHPDRCGCVREIAEHNAQAYAEAIAALSAKDARISALEKMLAKVLNNVSYWHSDCEDEAWILLGGPEGVFAAGTPEGKAALSLYKGRSGFLEASHFEPNRPHGLEVTSAGSILPGVFDAEAATHSAKDARIAELEKGSGFRLMPGESLQTKTDINGRVISACIMAANGEPAPDGMARMAVLAAQQQAEPCDLITVPRALFDQAVSWVEDRRRFGDYGTIHSDWLALKAIQRGLPIPASSEWVEAAHHPKDGREVPETVGKFCWMDEDMGDGYYVQCVHDLPEHIIDNERALMTVAQHERIVAAKDAEIALLRGPEQTVTSPRGDKLFTFMSKDPCRYRLCEVTYANPVRRLIAERDALRAEVEALKAQPARQVGGDEPWRDEDLMLVPRALLGAVRYALKNKKDAPNLYDQLGEYCYTARAALAPAAKEGE